jgi:hypothetical protein
MADLTALNRLEQLARAVPVESISPKWWTVDELMRAMNPDHICDEDAAFIAACDPSTVLALIAIARTAKPTLAALKLAAANLQIAWKPDTFERDPSAVQLRAAIAALARAAFAGPRGVEQTEPFWCHEQSHDRPRCEAQCAECAEDGMDDFAMACLREVAKLDSMLEHTRYWYGQRMERLSTLAREELDEPLRTRFFSIVANGSPDVIEPPTSAQNYNAMKARAETAESELVRLRASATAGVPASSQPESVPCVPCTSPDYCAAHELWRVERNYARRTGVESWTVKRGDEYLRGEGRYKTVRRFRTEAGAALACDKANGADGVQPSDGEKL